MWLSHLTRGENREARHSSPIQRQHDRMGASPPAPLSVNQRPNAPMKASFQSGVATMMRNSTVPHWPQEFARLQEQGWKAADLAEHFGVSPSTITRLRRSLGVPTQFLTPERVARIEAMLDDGWSFKEIHRTEGVDMETLRKRWPGRAWTMRQRDEYASNVRYFG